MTFGKYDSHMEYKQRVDGYMGQVRPEQPRWVLRRKQYEPLAPSIADPGLGKDSWKAKAPDPRHPALPRCPTINSGAVLKHLDSINTDLSQKKESLRSLGMSAQRTPYRAVGDGASSLTSSLRTGGSSPRTISRLSSSPKKRLAWAPGHGERGLQRTVSRASSTYDVARGARATDTVGVYSASHLSFHETGLAPKSPRDAALTGMPPRDVQFGIRSAGRCLSPETRYHEHCAQKRVPVLFRERKGGFEAVRPC